MILEKRKYSPPAKRRRQVGDICEKRKLSNIREAEVLHTCKETQAGG